MFFAAFNTTITSLRLNLHLASSNMKYAFDNVCFVAFATTIDIKLRPIPHVSLTPVFPTLIETVSKYTHH
jgi:hypothetical protein